MNWLPIVTDLRSWVIVFLVVLVSVFVRAILRGELVPRSHVEDVRTDRDSRLSEIAHERDSWREAHGLSEQTRAIMAQQVEKLLATSELTNQLLVSLKDTEGRKP